MMRDLPRSVLSCAGLVATVLLAGMSAVLLAYGRGDFDATYELTADFPSASQGIFTDGTTEVRMRGVPIGTVRDIELLDDGRARVTLSMRDGAEVPTAVAASLEPVSVFGPRFVDLRPEAPGDDGPFLADGDRITNTRTGVGLADVLEEAGTLLAAVDPADLMGIVDAVGTGVAGQGDRIGETIDDGARLVDLAHSHRDLFAQFLPDLRTVSTAIAERSGRFLERVQDYRTVAELLARTSDDLPDLLDSTALVAGRGAALLRDAAEEFDLTVRSMAAVMNGVYDHRELIPASLDAVGAFFDMLGAGMRLPGPDGTKLTALRGFITVDLCLVFDICLGPAGAPAAAAAAAGGPPTLAGSTTPRGPSQPDQLGLGPFVSALVDPLTGGAP
jgi:virulence factor Mce-like protein